MNMQENEFPRRLGSNPGPCITTAIWHCRKHFSQWQHSFQWKLRSHWLKFLRQRHVALVIQDPGHDRGKQLASLGNCFPVTIVSLLFIYCIKRNTFLNRTETLGEFLLLNKIIGLVQGCGYLQCVSNRDTTVLRWAIILCVHDIDTRLTLYQQTDQPRAMKYSMPRVIGPSHLMRYNRPDRFSLNSINRWIRIHFPIIVYGGHMLHT